MAYEGHRPPISSFNRVKTSYRFLLFGCYDCYSTMPSFLIFSPESATGYEPGHRLAGPNLRCIFFIGFSGPLGILYRQSNMGHRDVNSLRFYLIFQDFFRLFANLFADLPFCRLVHRVSDYYCPFFWPSGTF